MAAPQVARLAALLAGLLVMVQAIAPASAQSELKIMRVGWCAKTVSGVAAPFAVAAKMGWFEKAGFKV